jgi:hypothetical protein
MYLAVWFHMDFGAHFPRIQPVLYSIVWKTNYSQFDTKRKNSKKTKLHYITSTAFVLGFSL